MSRGGGTMKISSATAKEIVNQISEVLGQKINIMDTDGVIIASSTAEREGSIHGGAKKIIEENLKQLIVENDLQYEGSQNGVNLPIIFQREIIGIIGITGKVEDVLKYGQIIKKMTEILLLDGRIKEQEIIEQKARDRFFDEWILCGYESKNPQEFYRMAEAFAVDVSKPKRIAVLQILSENKVEDRIQTEISRYIRKAVHEHFGGNVFRTATKIVCVLDEMDEEFLISGLREILYQIRNLFNCRLVAGIDSEAEVLHLYDNFRKAVKALELSIKRDSEVTCYDELDINFVLGNVPKEVCMQYIRRLFGDIELEEIQKYLDFAKIYLEANGSLVVMSEQLFLHKNTVKYKIKKLEQITGIDIRTSNGIYTYTLALKLWENVR